MMADITYQQKETLAEFDSKNIKKAEFQDSHPEKMTTLKNGKKNCLYKILLVVCYLVGNSVCY